jgi:hypothetical protein
MHIRYVHIAYMHIVHIDRESLSAYSARAICRERERARARCI